jgi:hypothetical protein
MMNLKVPYRHQLSQDRRGLASAIGGSTEGGGNPRVSRAPKTKMR